uniref:Uncharacterized protein n=1 Tax=Rhizophora mucronata TaxID=61149 RepID=A0A2P2INZ1_RHIMU
MMFILARTGSKESCSHYSSKLIIRYVVLGLRASSLQLAF